MKLEASSRKSWFGQILRRLDDACAERLHATCPRLPRGSSRRSASVGTMSVSTSRTHGLKSIDEKYSPATRACSSVAARPIRSMKAGGLILGSPVLRGPFRQSAICCTMYS